MRYKTESVTILLGLRKTERAGRRHLYVRGKWKFATLWSAFPFRFSFIVSRCLARKRQIWTCKWGRERAERERRWWGGGGGDQQMSASERGRALITLARLSQIWLNAWRQVSCWHFQKCIHPAKLWTIHEKNQIKFPRCPTPNPSLAPLPHPHPHPPLSHRCLACLLLTTLSPPGGVVSNGSRIDWSSFPTAVFVMSDVSVVAVKFLSGFLRQSGM